MESKDILAGRQTDCRRVAITARRGMSSCDGGRFLRPATGYRRAKKRPGDRILAPGLPHGVRLSNDRRQLK